VLLVINKIDRLKDRASLLPLMKQSSERMAFAEIVPVAALSGENIRDLERSIVSYLPEQKALFPVGQVTDRGERFIAAELVREQIFQVLRQEVPYAVAVGIDSFERAGRLLRVEAVVWVGKPGQKRILVGHQGECLKLIGTQARAQMEHMFGCKVHLELWVKVRSNWADSATLLHTLEYGQAEP
jgi:GTPase